MDIRVKFVAWLRDAAGASDHDLVLPPGARARDAQQALLDRFPRLQGCFESVRLAVNLEYQPWDAVLRDGDEIVFIPPVSGG